MLIGGQVTISMSALFDPGTGVIMEQVDLVQNLELRRVPRVSKDEERLRGYGEDGYKFDRRDNTARTSMLLRAYLQSGTNWLYTAMIQTTLNGPEPPWSSDGWSFVPIDLSEVQEHKALKERQSKAVNQFAANLTVHTHGLRGRIECSVIEEAQDTSLWLTAINESNITAIADAWNHTLPDTATGMPRNYTANGTLSTQDPAIAPFLDIIGHDTYHVPKWTMFSGDLRTRLTAEGLNPKCCANVSDTNQQFNPGVIAYWTENWERTKPPPIDPNPFEPPGARPTGNFTIKWVRGPVGFARPSNGSGIPFKGGNLYFTELPAIQALNCMPLIEAAKAEVSIDSRNGKVQTYRILDEPVPEDVAWSDSWTFRNASTIPPGEGYEFNVTTR